MAYVKVMASHKAIAALRYGEHEESVTRGAVGCECDTEIAISQFKADRVIWNKDAGVEAHIIIQSFDGTECDAETANKIGQELAKRIAPNHRAMVYTHTESDGGNIHNHIVINSVNTENGKKIISSGLLNKSRDLSDELVKEYGLSVIEERSAKLRYTQAERGLTDRGKTSWKDKIRDAIDESRSKSRTFADVVNHLEKDYNIKTVDHGEGRKYRLTYVDEEGHKVRGARLGDAYEKGGIEHELEKQRSNDISRAESIRNSVNRDDSTTARTNNAIDESGRAMAKIRAEREAERARILADAKRAKELESKRISERNSERISRERNRENTKKAERDYGFHR